MSMGKGQDLRSHVEPPPPVEARFFYTSPVALDDPLSPVPPPATGAAVAKQPPKPFSEYDNAALDKAWHELRRKIRQYTKEGREKNGNGASGRARRGSSKDAGRAGSGSRPTTPRTRAAKPVGSSFGQVDGVSTDNAPSASILDGTSLNPDATTLANTTGTPFARAPSDKRTSTIRGGPSRPALKPHDTYQWDDASHLVEHTQALEDHVEEEDESPSATVAVGVSRLHQVEMPDLLMTPIYWKPVHDTAAVVRATWFHQDTMLPVETPVANMLEAGYVDLKCWTDTWQDELKSAIEVGAVGEMKIVHKLWPTLPSTSSRPVSRSRQGTSLSDAPQSLLRAATANMLESEPDTPVQVREKAVEAACDVIDIAAGPNGHDNKASGSSTYPGHTYSSWGVIYANAREARLLKPSLLPSDYYGRRPLAGYIRKGHKLGLKVVRGFNQAAWDRLHPPKDGPEIRKAEQGTATSASGAPPNRRKKTDPDLARAERPKVTDLILVIHGIGQKLSERMESFHFTHAINNFRREVNVEVGSKETKALFRKDMGGIMVLPVNWRHLLSFDEGGYRDIAKDPGANEFTLADIMPHTIPSVRSVIADVMLDIPYYMSQHQGKVIAAVIKEANRVYRLWCINNPGFAQAGRVHLIAHSLGSVIAMDILSKQPTRIPEHLTDPTSIDLEAIELDHFLFNTSHVYFAGSPAGFFLFLHKAQLLPRGDDKAEHDPLAICGKQGQYGCLAVENIYNIINPYDPVANKMNAAVDAELAASLKQATIPSATASWFGVGSKAASPYAIPTSARATAASTTLPRLPSNVELETHNFTREEIAEKRMQMLNDNGQIDFWLRYGGGTFQIQYLTMLSAHSSYWLLKDFTRMIVAETGRASGRDGTYLSMRGAKKKRVVQ